MNPVFEAKYIQITWADKRSAISIEESNNAIEIKQIDSLEYHLDAITFSKVNIGKLGQLAFRKLDGADDLPLTFDVNTTEKNELIPVKDTLTGKIWWVEADKWNSEKKRWESAIFRSAGEVTLNIGKVKCLIYISSSSFSYKELELYLQDFRNDFWYLILHETSYIKGSAKKNDLKLLDSSSISYIAEFIKYAESIIKKPKKELRETQNLQPAIKIRPVPRTFMEISTKGLQRMLTSRAYIDSYNVPENKYVHYLVTRILLLIRSLNEVAKYTSNIQKRTVDGYQERLDNFSDIRTIDKDVLENEIEELTQQLKHKEKQLEAEKELLANAVQQQDHSSTPLEQTSIIVRLTKQTSHNALSFFGKAKLNKKEDWFAFKDKNKYLRFIFPEAFRDALKFTNNYYDYEIKGTITKYKRPPNASGKTEYSRTFNYISSIEIAGSTLENDIKKTKSSIKKTEDNKRILESQNWQQPINNREKQEQEKEKESVKKSIELAYKAYELSAKLSKELAPHVSKLKAIKKSLVKLNIDLDSSFPNSMTFVQNPDYQGVHKLYKQIMQLSGFDENTFIALQEVEKIGIVNIALIYERWCLLQIIKVLIDKYRYLPEEQWKEKLIEQVLHFKKDRKIVFTNENVGREITLWYEKELANGKRPDFILDVKVTYCDKDNNQNVGQHRLVLDAKFYEQINAKKHGGISTVIKNLYSEKNYSEEKKNAVFVLHPSKQSIPKKKTPQTWAVNSFYGENQLFGWDEPLRNEQNHMYGAVLLSPVMQSRYLDDLQRLIGMFLQYGIEKNRGCRNKGADVNGTPFCLVCGSEKNLSHKKNNSWNTCAECGHFTAYNHCQKCGNRLIKHGEYWTYHATKALETFNIKCPSCANLLEGKM
jgi:pyrethroid hydrolase